MEDGRIPAADAASIPTEQAAPPVLSFEHQQWALAVAKDHRVAAFREDADAASIVCALHGHAAVETGFMGEWGCDRCGAVVGDSLMGGHRPKVIRGHDCAKCRTNWSDACFWQRFGVEPDGSGFLQQDRVKATTPAETGAVGIAGGDAP